jgi:hypothetical protein
MNQGLDEYLEDYEDSFQLSYKRAHNFILDED